jgi:protein ImuA
LTFSKNDVLLLEQKENKFVMPSYQALDLRPAPTQTNVIPWISQYDPRQLLVSGFHELLGTAPGDETVALAFAFSLAGRAAHESSKGLCFCGAAGNRQERGELYGHGLADLGIQPERMLMVTAAKEKDLLWTLEEAVASGAFATVIGSLGAKERLYGFSASRRLKLRAAASQTPLFLLRHRSDGGATAAQGRWTVSVLPSRSEGEHGGYTLLGPPRLRLTLERMGGLPPQSWEMGFDDTGDFNMAALLEDRPARKARGRRQAA